MRGDPPEELTLRSGGTCHLIMHGQHKVLHGCRIGGPQLEPTCAEQGHLQAGSPQCSTSSAAMPAASKLGAYQR